MADRLDSEADAVVRSLVGVGEFDAVRDFSSALPVRVVADLIGLWATGVFDAADRGELGRFEARMMIIDFVAPGLDTTILAATHMLWLLGRNPEAWQRLRQEPELIPAAVVEAVRIASPVRCFTRRVSREAGFGGVELNAGDRVALLFGAANMDERRFPQPERFDLDRPPGRQGIAALPARLD